ncbi:hypothetical protein J2T55_002582 [Methylohalomonas lacus]|uniref:DUF1826 domain-containing protein n=1 Tax=Methylohalomonas lacus TaxID=398773 RepID=A0AAE3HPI6_9GAMM|nr:DUF1826 domain-containing protein [Methylohalomonas lacus]MCS3904543.1 hypothetical protein [Methylohalomonas lacus]
MTTALDLGQAGRSDHYQYVNAPGQFGVIHQPGVNLAVWPRTLDHRWSGLLRRLLRERVHAVATLEPVDVEWLLLTEFARLSETDADSIELIRDIQNQARVFAELAGSATVTMRLEVVNTDECRLFHVDRHRLRLLCTYAGPGMEWLGNLQVNRAALGHGSNQRVLRQGRSRQLAPGHVAVLKGELYPGNAGNGIVHRSPTIGIAGQQRLRLRFDQPVAAVS